VVVGLSRWSGGCMCPLSFGFLVVVLARFSFN
jgi:hypothetical protein